ncbi:ataxin-7-like [Maniola jurtina]|uniref:ataxin-7-like n=1 Tax=Maniola jurtina TaxID=191418 RepID=UPI001E68C791|nr:ataxin-7-like [Maniola jurtina]
MSGEFPFAAKTVSPLKCIEKPWDLWVSEIGHPSPRRDDDGATFTAPAAVDKAGARRDKGRPRYRRAGVSRLRYDSMSLHGLFPQMDELNAAVCHMCGELVKCSAAYRHLRDSHAEPLPPPPPPAVKLKAAPGRARHKREPPPAPLQLPAAPDLRLLEEAAAAALAADVQVSVASGELPVVSIQDPEELPLGDNLTDDIFAIMNSEGIQSADDITNVADWKNIIQDIGNMQEINFPSTTDTVQTQDLYPTVDASLAGYTITDADLSSLQFATDPSPMLPSVIDPSLFNAQALKPAPTTPSTKASTRRASKTKFNLREYDPNKHCGVVTAENPKPCTRSLTCKAHALSLRRTVEGRAKPFDTLLAEHRAARDAAQQPTAPPEPAPGLERHVHDIYASLLSDEPALPDAALAALLSPPPPAAPHVPPPAPPPPAPPDAPPPLVPADVCWYAACPRPLALCTFNAAHAGGAVTLGKKFATVRSNIKSSLSRSNKTTSAVNSYYGQSLSLSKTMHMNNASKANKPEVRKLIVTCSAGRQHALSELFGADVRHALNGHAPLAERRPRPLKGKRSGGAMDLGFSLDPLLADEKC